MSFRRVLLFFLTISFSLSCGVKGPPVPPPNSAIPSYVDKFIVTPKPVDDKKKSTKKEADDVTEAKKEK